MRTYLRLGWALSLFLFFQACANGLNILSDKSAFMVKVLHKNKILTLPIEDYVARVLAGEVSESWPMEALKAQAIAARTFAVRKMKQRANAPYHLQNSVMDQVFKKKTKKKFQDATLSTEGMVLSDGKTLVEASFHSTCGGHTTDSQNVWGGRHQHLTGVRCPYCQVSPTYNWTFRIPVGELEKKLGTKVNELKVINRSSDGRAKNVEVRGENTIQMSGHKLRAAIGQMKLKSTLIENIVVEGANVTFTGHGFGHGVGMCQYGALGMAKKGFDAEQILKFYYPNTRTVRLY